MEKNAYIQDFTDTFLRIVNKFKMLEKIPIDHGTGHLLYASEMNTLDVIGKCSGINLTQLAEKRCVTIGAVSQVVAKLENKQLVQKNYVPENKKEVSLQVTDLGAVALQNHEKFHAKYDQPMIDRIFEMNTEQLQTIREVFQLLEKTIDSYLRELK